MIIEGGKHCPKCEATKIHFPRNSATRDGAGAWCNDCQRDYTQEGAPMTDRHYPTKPGFRLTEDGEELHAQYNALLRDGGCYCHLSPPCSVCTHEGHPICIEETPELWEPDEPAAIDWLKINGDIAGGK